MDGVLRFVSRICGSFFSVHLANFAQFVGIVVLLWECSPRPAAAGKGASALGS